MIRQSFTPPELCTIRHKLCMQYIENKQNSTVCTHLLLDNKAWAVCSASLMKLATVKLTLTQMLLEIFSVF